MLFSCHNIKSDASKDCTFFVDTSETTLYILLKSCTLKLCNTQIIIMYQWHWCSVIHSKTV